MWAALVSIIFKVLNWLVSIIMAPIFLVISLVMPNANTYISQFNQWLGWGLQYINFFIDLFMIPRAPLIAVISLGIGLITFVITMRVASLIIAIWKTFKP